MISGEKGHNEESSLDSIRAACSTDDLASILRQLRRRDARRRGDSLLSYRELAGRTGWAHGVIGDYFSGRTLAPTDRFDVLVGLLGATQQELGALATARDRVEEIRRKARHSGGTESPALQQLPAPASGFVGRDWALSRADELLGAAEPVTGTRIVAFCGTAGVGKTALALYWAKRVGNRFPDGSVYVDLRGYGAEEPMPPADALIGFLRSLGVSDMELAVGVGELAAQYRSLVAGRRVIIMLDNARSAEQIRPLLPGTSSSLTLVTSRDQLSGLVARDGAYRIPVKLFSPNESAQLLRNLLGSRAEEDPQATADLATRCVRLPLALRIAAELATRRPSTSLAALVTELGDTPRTLDLLDAGGDANTAVRQILSWSYRNLSPAAATCFRSVGLFPGTEFEIAALAALAGMAVHEAQRHADELDRASLIDSSGPGRYTTHDLLRVYAKERATADPELAHEATDRLRQHYLQACSEAVAAVYPVESSNLRKPEELSIDAREALTWLESELANIVALSHQGIHSGHWHFVTALSERLWHYLDLSGRYPEAMAIHGNAVTAARARGDVRQEAAALGELGQAHARQGRFQMALDHLFQALELSRRAGDLAREATSLNSISIAYSRLGRSDEAIDHLHQALTRYRSLANQVGEGKVLSNLGIEYAQVGRYALAMEHFELALRIARERGDRYGEGNARTNLGLVSCWLGRYENALQHHELGLACARAIGDHAGVGRVLANLGVNHTRIGNYPQALKCLHDALRIHREVGDRAAEAEALTYLGDLSHATGDRASALDQHDQSLSLAQNIGYRHVQSVAHNGAGRALWALERHGEAAARFEAALKAADETGDRLQRAHALVGIARHHCQATRLAQARESWHRAAAIYSELGVPELDEVRAELRAISGSE